MLSREASGGSIMAHLWQSQRVAVLLTAISIGSTACGSDESFRQSFIPQDQPDNDEDLGPRSPILPDTQIWYTLAASYRRTSTVNNGGAITGEAQSGGLICVNIAEVKDTATSRYASAQETLVSAQIKVTDTVGSSPNLHTSDQANPSAGAADIDALLQPLWLKRLTFPSSGHGFAVAQSRDFHTQDVPTPATDFQSLLFFETRRLDKLNWSGWQYSDDMTQPRSYLDSLFDYFLAPPFSQQFFVDRNQFYRNTVTPPASCDQYTDARSCAANSCTWTLPPGGNTSKCQSIYSARLVWRESLEAPADIAGPVFHILEYAYDAAGILSGATEMIVPDTGGSLPAQNPGCGTKCLTANILNNGSWGEGHQAAACAF